MESSAIAMLSGRRLSRAGRSRGFTLIELMIVVGIVAILAAIAYPSYQNAMQKSRRGQAKADLVEYAQLAERFHTAQNTYVGFTLPETTSPRDGDQAFYNLEIDPQLQNEFVITATPIAASAQADDQCGVLTIASTGRRTHSTGTVGQCQFGEFDP